MNILDYSHFHLVGLKGVAMTALAQCLHDAGKTVTGSDVAEDFVTQGLLAKLPITIQTGFSEPLPVATECVIYTSAHNAQDNPQVRRALADKIPALSHAEALAQLFNLKQGLAVCGVGGKSTTAAMLTWMLNQADVSFAVGVGNIPGLDRTGRWSAASRYFVAEADEYVTDPNGARNGDNFVPRFSYLQPYITICTNLKYDHPDVYRDFDHTKQVYREFFLQLKPNGYLIVNGGDTELWTLAKEVARQRPDITVMTFGETAQADAQLRSFTSQEGLSVGQIFMTTPYEIKLHLPGKFNMLNAVAAFTAAYLIAQQAPGLLTADHAAASLADFRSTTRRSQFIGEKAGVKYYDDYAHHPNEVTQIIQAFQEWYPHQRVVIGFQSHTYSRTKELFHDFVAALSLAPEVVMIDIFASAREDADPTITADHLCAAVQAQQPHPHCQNVHTIDNLAQWCHDNLKPGDVFLTVGAGDIYQVHDQI